MLMLSLDDAVAVCMRLLHDETTFFDDMPSEEYESMPEFIKGEFEQKCWFPPKTDEAAKQLNDLIFDINPAEISNCRFVNRVTQANNTSKNHIVELNGHKMTVAEFARVMNIDKNHAWYYINKFEREVMNGQFDFSKIGD